MQLTVISILVVFLQEPTLARCGRVAGQTWGGAFKPTGLNTIIRNQCITSNGGGFFHHRGTEEGRATSKLVAEVAGPVTSRAVLALLLKVHFCFKFSFLIFFSFFTVSRPLKGAHLFSAATEQDGGISGSLCEEGKASGLGLSSFFFPPSHHLSFHHQVQYQLTCRSTNPHQMCLWLKAFVDTCTTNILGGMLQYKSKFDCWQYFRNMFHAGWSLLHLIGTATTHRTDWNWETM